MTTEKSLSLVIETPIEEITPSEIKWNKEEFQKYVATALERYRNIVYSDADIRFSKKDRATLNAFQKQLNDARIRVGKIYNTPLEKFKSEIDEVIRMVKDASSSIDARIKSYEESKAEQKKAFLHEYFVHRIGEYAELVDFSQICNLKWLNATYSEENAKHDIDKSIEDIRNSVQAIKALHSEDEEHLLRYFFSSLNLGETLIEHERLRSDREKLRTIVSNRSEGKHTDASQKAEYREPESAEKEETVSVVLKITTSKSKMYDLRQFMIDNQIKFSKP